MRDKAWQRSKKNKTDDGTSITDPLFPTMTIIAQVESFDVVQESNTKFAWQ